jgi:NAD(P)-dependent dehydrogenase (short-subunit alcohol dehydrogenase family)
MPDTDPSASPLPSLPDGYRAVVIGARGALGSAFVQRLQADPRCAGVAALHRASVPAIDYGRDGSVADAAAAVRDEGPFHLVLVATGMLHGPALAPEKRLADLDATALATLLQANTIGPALVLRHFGPLLDRQRSLLGVLSAKVGSIGDNRLGGWYGYRASKAALNMLLKTAAIELRRSHPGAVLAALHPGTVRSALSRPFRGDEIGREPAQAAAELLDVLDRLRAEDSGTFVSYSGERLPW